MRQNQEFKLVQMIVRMNLKVHRRYAKYTSFVKIKWQYDNSTVRVSNGTYT